MRKIVYLILLLSLLWLAKLSYDVSQYSQTTHELQQQLAQTEQRYSLLNDQFVALQRQVQSGRAAAPVENSIPPPMMMVGVAPVILIKQHLELVQFAIDQQQFIYALEHLNQLQQQIVQYNVAPALQQSLMKAIEQDRLAIQQYVLAQTQQQQQLDNLLQQLDQRLQAEIDNPTVQKVKIENRAWWKWFSFEKVQRVAPDLINRSIILKEAQLRLLLASQALHHNQMSEYRKSILEVMQILADLPDRDSQQMKMKLEKISNFPTVPAPKLTTLGLLG